MVCLFAVVAIASIAIVSARIGRWPSLSSPETVAALGGLPRDGLPPRPRTAPAAAPAPPDEAPAPDVEQRLKSLSLEAKVSQLFIVGFMGQRIEQGLSDTIKARMPGAIIVFGRNIKSAEQVSNLCYSAQIASFDAVGLPLLIAVDQEGGNVIRIHTAPPLPSALAFGSTHDPKLVREAGLGTGRLLRSLGFNMNLAPVMDVTDPTRDKFIGTRTFGNDPQLVTDLSAAFADGLQTSGVLPTAKHFPGHGGLNEDSHLGTPTKLDSLAEMTKRDLVPFTEAARSTSPPAMMIAHVAYPKLDPSGLPATFSKPIVTDLLRKKLGFDGIVVTDDIEMAGASAIRDPPERAVRAIEAGADLVMIGWNKRLQRSLRAAVLAAVKNGRIAESRIDESVRRLLRAKARFASFERPTRPDKKAIVDALDDETLRGIFSRTLRSTFDRASAQVDRAYFNERPNSPVLVFSGTESFFRSFKDGLDEGRATRFYRLDAEGSVHVDRIMRMNPEALGVFYVTGTRSAALANALSDDVASRMVLVNTEAGSALIKPKKFRQVVDVAFRHAAAGGLTAKTFFPAPARVPATKDR